MLIGYGQREIIGQATIRGIDIGTKMIFQVGDAPEFSATQYVIPAFIYSFAMPEYLSVVGRPYPFERRHFDYLD